MHPKFKRKLAVGAVLLAAAAFAGGAFAATQNSPVSVRQAFLNDVAKRLNVTPQQLTSAIRNAYFDQLQSAVAAHRLTQAQANAIKRKVQRGGPTGFGGLPVPFGLPVPLGLAVAPNAVPPGKLPMPVRPGLFPAPRRPGALPVPVRPLLFPAPMRPGLMPKLMFARPLIVFGGLEASARYLGLTPMQLMQKLRAGRSLAQIASAGGKSVSGLEQAIMASERSMLDRLVAGRWLTRAREQKLLARLSRKINALVNGRFPRMPMPPALGLRFAPRVPGKPQHGVPLPALPFVP